MKVFKVVKKDADGKFTSCRVSQYGRGVEYQEGIYTEDQRNGALFCFADLTSAVRFSEHAEYIFRADGKGVRRVKWVCELFDSLDAWWLARRRNNRRKVRMLGTGAPNGTCLASAIKLEECVVEARV